MNRLKDECEKAYKTWQEDLERCKSLEIEKEDKKIKKNQIDELLKENSLSTSLQEQKKLLSDKLDFIDNEKRELYKKKVRLAIRSVTLIKLYPRIEATLKIIEKKGDSGDYSVLLSRKQLENILKNAIEKAETDHQADCPVCGSGLTMHQILYIQKIISRQTIDDDTSLTLRALKEDLLAAKEEIIGFKDTYQNILHEEIELQDEYSETEKQYNDVSEKLTRLGAVRDENGKLIDFSKLESDNRKLGSDISSLDQAIGAAKVLSNNHESTYIAKNKEYEEAVERENDDAESQKVINVLGMVIENLTTVKNSITYEVRMKLEAITKKIFMKVVKKKESFGKISISDSYLLSLYDVYGQLMTGSSSETEYMMLAYSYTLAIHEASGHNCPLVIDSPLGRVSGEIRTNTVSTLLEISKRKQIIMLFTEDEYSERVKKIFDGKAVMRTIDIDKHEKSWEESTL